MGDDVILISDITANAKERPHFTVLTGQSGSLIEDVGGTHVFVNTAGSAELSGGPVEGKLYKLKFNVAGEYESVLRMTFIGKAAHHGRYVFTKKT